MLQLLNVQARKKSMFDYHQMSLMRKDETRKTNLSDSRDLSQMQDVREKSSRSTQKLRSSSEKKKI